MRRLRGSVVGDLAADPISISFHHVSNIIGPLVFLSNEAKRNYPTAKLTIIGTLAGASAVLFCVGIVHALWNRRRDQRAARSDAESHQVAQGPGLGSETDFQYVQLADQCRSC